MTKRHDQYLRELSELMPEFYPANAKNIPMMLEQADKVQRQYKAKITKNFPSDIVRRFFMCQAKRHADNVLTDDFSSAKYQEYVYGFARISLNFKPIFEKAGYTLQGCDVVKILRREWKIRRLKHESYNFNGQIN